MEKDLKSQDQGKNKREKYLPDEGSIICPPGKWSRENKDSSYALIEPDSVLIYELTVNEYKPGVLSVVTDHKKIYLMK